ncbi:hypothetical protein [Vulgatibacter sp.]|uniref:hypothetical protein n=1 Tax=Vulgatibacter sp. TaxID=1971226 RepID=UPI003562BDEF
MTHRSLLFACAVLVAAACSSKPEEKAAPQQPAAIAAPATKNTQASQAEVTAAPVTLLVTGDNWGEIAPCG